MTKKQLVDDIILRVTKGAPSDDLELEPRQIAFWFDLVAKTLVPDYLNTLIKDGDTIDPFYIEIEDNKVGVVENVAMLDIGDDRVYITVTKPVMPLIHDAGVIRIITEEGTVVNNAPIEHLDTLNKLTFGKPSRENLLYSRINDRLYIHGFKPQHIAILKFSVTYIPTIDISSLADGDTVKITDSIVSILSEAVEKMALKELSVIPDEENDAQDDNMVG